ncbi:MAG: hypothetical protein D6730_25720 [Bacteroidetes bacterium]|nr:MAG: hypothetical protein D6730_25720 [Bacteroidota bacterium]
MTLIHALLHALRLTLQYRKLLLYMYLLMLGLALLLVLPFYATITAAVGHSLEIDKLLPGFNYTVIADFLNAHGDIFSALLAQIQWMLPFYLLLGIFLSAGCMHCLVKERSTAGAFFRGGIRWFGPFLGLGILLGLLHLLLAGLCYAPFFLALSAGMDQIRNEVGLFNKLFAGAGLHLLLIPLLWALGDRARLEMVQAGVSVRKALPSSIFWIKTHFFSAAGLYILVGFFIYGIFSLSLYLQSESAADTGLMIFLLFGVQQLLVLLRLAAKLLRYAAMYSLHQYSSVTRFADL